MKIETTPMKNPMTTAGDTIYGGTSGVETRLAKGTASQVLTMNAGATAPEWAVAAGGGTDLFATATLTHMFVAPNIQAGSSNSYVQYSSGSGAAVSDAYIDCRTGATSGSTDGVTLIHYVSSTPGSLNWAKNASMRWTAQMSNSGNTASEYAMFMGNTTGVYPTYTSNHIGFRKENGSTTKYATNGNGTNETTTSVTITDGANHDFMVVFTSGTNAKFYVDGVLVATHTTNLPTTGEETYVGNFGVKNNTTTSFQLNLHNVIIQRTF